MCFAMLLAHQAPSVTGRHMNLVNNGYIAGFRRLPYPIIGWTVFVYGLLLLCNLRNTYADRWGRPILRKKADVLRGISLVPYK